MNLQSRVERLEKDAQVDIPPGAKLYDGDGVQVDAAITRMPGKQAYGEALLTDGTARPIAPFVKITLEVIIRRARERKEKRRESHARTELPADILFLRVDGKEGFCEIISKAQRRRAASS